MEERIQKILARAGFGSRRACEELISGGRVRVDGELVRELGTRADAAISKIAVDGRPVRLNQPVYYLVNKPKGFVCTSESRSPFPRVIDLVPRRRERLYTVGRLDKDTVGIIIVTNDGDFANMVMHPRFGVKKTYIATVEGLVKREDVQAMERGVYLSEGRTLPARVLLIRSNRQMSTLKITVKEGRNRLVRRMLAKLGFKVRHLRRIAIGPITARGLKVGGTRLLGRHEIESVYEKTE